MGNELTAALTGPTHPVETSGPALPETMACPPAAP
jgi:hypothetical protein